MAIAMLVDNPDGTQEIYDKVREQLHLEAPAGGILHVAGAGSEWRLACHRGVGIGRGREPIP